MKIAYNPKGSTAITSSTALSDDLIFDLTGLKVWAKGTMMGTDWSVISNKPSTYTPSAHTHSTLDINKADATTIGSNQDTFQVLYYDTNTLTGKPEAANGVGVLKLKTNASLYGEIALTSGNNVYTRTNTTLLSGTWDKLLKASTTKVTNGVGLIDGTTITQVSKANTWTTARSFTIGNSTKSVDGSANVSWSLADLGVNNRDIQVNGTSIGTNTLNLKAGNNISLSNSSGTVTITAKDTYRPVQVNSTSIGDTTTLNLANGNYIAVSNSSGKVIISLTNNSTTANLALLTTGTAGGWSLKTLNIDAWNTATTWVNTVSGTADANKAIDKWTEIVNFLNGIDDSENTKLNTLLNSKLSLYSVAANDNTASYSNTGLYTNTGVTATNMPFSASPYTLLNVSLGNSKYARLALNNSGNINVYTGSAWIPVLTSANASVSGLTITINGVSTTWSNTWRPVSVSGTSIGNASLNIAAGTGITVSNLNGTVTITNSKNFDNKINITQSSTNANFPIIFAATANATTQSDTLCKKYSNLTFNPNTNVLSTTAITCSTINASTSVVSTFQHKDLTGNSNADNFALTAGGSYTAIDKTINSSVISESITTAITTNWTDISGFTGTFLASGTYIVEIYVKAATGISEGYFSGVMSWYNGTTTSASTDEIVLHRAGSSYTNTLYLRTIESVKDNNVSGSGVCKMQIAANTALASTTYTFKFKLIC